MTGLEYLISVLTPLECLICKEEGFMLCAECAAATVPKQISRCYICNKLTPQHQICTSCRSKSRIRRAWWLGNYKDELKLLIHAMKYERKRAYARDFGTLLAEGLPYLPKETLVVPIPTASTRRRQRGFDQAVLIAESFARTRNLKLAQPLTRTSQVDQIGKRRSERLQQMLNSFRIKQKSHIEGATLLLIDDVLTTGATAESAAALLRENGAKHVDVAVVARHLLT